MRLSATIGAVMSVVGAGLALEGGGTDVATRGWTYGGGVKHGDP